MANEPITLDTLQHVFTSLEAEEMARSRVETRLDVLNLSDHPPIDPHLEPWAGPGGRHIALFLARQGTDSMQQVRDALADPSKAQALRDQMTQKIDEHPGVPFDRVPEVLAEQPVFAEIRYGDEVIVQYLWVDEGLGLCGLTFPYTGARPKDDAFRMVEFVKQGSDARLEGLIVRRPLPRSEAEQAAEAQVDGHEIRVGISPYARSTLMIAATYAASAVAAAWAVALAGPAPGAFDVADLGEDALGRLADQPSVEELIAMRSRALKSGD